MRSLAIVFLISIICLPVYSAERYDDIKKKINSSDLSIFFNGFEKIVMAYELESDFVRDCLLSVKITKKLPTQECTKLTERSEGVINLSSIIASSNFKTNLMKIAFNIDSKKGNISEEDLNNLTKKFEQSFSKYNKLVEEVNFVLSNL